MVYIIFMCVVRDGRVSKIKKCPKLNEGIEAYAENRQEKRSEEKERKSVVCVCVCVCVCFYEVFLTEIFQNFQIFSDYNIFTYTLTET